MALILNHTCPFYPRIFFLINDALLFQFLVSHLESCCLSSLSTTNCTYEAFEDWLTLSLLRAGLQLNAIPTKQIHNTNRDYKGLDFNTHISCQFITHGRSKKPGAVRLVLTGLLIRLKNEGSREIIIRSDSRKSHVWLLVLKTQIIDLNVETFADSLTLQKN